MGGFFDLTQVTLGRDDYLTLKTGYRLPPPVSLDSGESALYDGVTFRVSFFESDPQTAILIGSSQQFNDGTVTDWLLPIPPELVEKSDATTALMIARMQTIENAGRYGSTAFTTRGNRW